MTSHTIVSREEWETERVALLEKEKELTRRSDELARERQALPWVKVESDYTFATEQGPRTLPELFDGHGQLIAVHFMFGEGWGEGCPSCSFWADSYDGIEAHLAARDVSLVAVSSAPLDDLLAYRDRMEWSFPWVSSAHTTFNQDFEVAGTTRYNYRDTDEPIGESHGVSAFALDHGSVFHTYSAYGRGVEPYNAAYGLLDMAPKGRDEDDLAWTMEWLRRHDSYE